MLTDPEIQQLADSRRHHQRARLRHARAWIEADMIQPPEQTDAVMKPGSPTPPASREAPR